MKTIENKSSWSSAIYRGIDSFVAIKSLKNSLMVFILYKVTNAYQILGDDHLRELYNSSSSGTNRNYPGRRTKANSTTSSNPFGDYAEDEEDPYRYAKSVLIAFFIAFYFCQHTTLEQRCIDVRLTS